MLGGKASTLRHSRRTGRNRAAEDAGRGEVLSEFNSFFRRTVRRDPGVILEESDRKTELLCDFLGLITAINGLYSQEDVLPMQQIDNRHNDAVGSGAVFEVVTIEAASTRPSRTVANKVEQETKAVIVKRSPLEIFTSEGKIRGESHHQQAAASFIMELRVLSFPSIRSCENIVTLLGIAWEYGRSELGCPWPSLILERAYSTLAGFQVTCACPMLLKRWTRQLINLSFYRNPSLPYLTKQLLCLDVAQGLSALHQCGIIHGDVKLDNILIFETHRFVAKVADFSHAMLDTGEKTYLLGGTMWYTAPEWQEKLPTSLLLQTDVYSFGLVFSSTILGYDVVEKFLGQLRNGRTAEARAENLTLKKKEGKLQDYIIDLMYGLYDVDLFSGLDYIPDVQLVLDLTLQVDPNQRDLRAVIRLLSRVNDPPTPSHKMTVLKSINSDILAIPYQAMKNMSRCLKDQVARALETVAEDLTDDRNAAACYELCICYTTGFGVDVAYAKAMSWLVAAAERNDDWARLMIHRLGAALGQQVPGHLPVNQWLADAANKGAEVARQSLDERGIPFDRKALCRAQIRFPNKETGQPYGDAKIPEVDEEEIDRISKSLRCPQDPHGNTRLHLAALLNDQQAIQTFSEEHLPDFTAALDVQNSYGDTVLHMACKMGNFDLVKFLLELGANAALTNNFGETCLHFLTCFSDADGADVATLLFNAGTDSTREASASSMLSDYSVFPDASGCSKVRSVLLNRPKILDILMTEEEHRKSSMNEKQKRMLDITPRKLLAWACRTNNAEVLRVLHKHSPDTLLRSSINDFEMWIEGTRFSLAALAISGCVGERPGVGFNLPDLFQRLLMYGVTAKDQSEQTINLLNDWGVEFARSKCSGWSNALFFAIHEAREEVVDQLLNRTSGMTELAAFGHLPCEQCAAAGLKHRDKESLTAAIKLAITLDNREIFRKLLRFHDGEALDEGKVFPVAFENHGKLWKIFRGRKRKEETLKSAEHFFPSASDFPNPIIALSSTRVQHSRQEVYDGQLSYDLLFMNFIAGADSRDLGLATVLFEQMEMKGKPGVQRWSIRNALENYCLPGVIASPLFMSTLYGWNEMTDMLLDHGADPRATTMPFDSHSYSNSKIFGTPEEKRSIISSLVAEVGPTERYESVKKTLKEQDTLRVLRAIIRMLKAVSRPEHRTEPLNTCDLRRLILSVMHFSDRESADLWEVVGQVYRECSWYCLSDFRKVIPTAVMYRNYHALKTMAELGYPLKGTLIDQIFGTPFDITAKPNNILVRRENREWLSNPQFGENEGRCRKLISEHGGHRSAIYTLEVQIIGNIFSLTLLAAFTYAAFGTVELQHNSCIEILERWYGEYKRKDITPWAFIFRVPFAYTPFLPPVLTSLIIFFFLLIYWDDHEPLDVKDVMNVVVRLLLPFSYFTLDDLTWSPYLTTVEMVGPTWKFLKPHVEKVVERKARAKKKEEDAIIAAANLDLEAGLKPPEEDPTAAPTSEDDGNEAMESGEPSSEVETKEAKEPVDPSSEEETKEVKERVKSSSDDARESADPSARPAEEPTKGGSVEERPG